MASGDILSTFGGRIGVGLTRFPDLSCLWCILVSAGLCLEACLASKSLTKASVAAIGVSSGPSALGEKSLWLLLSGICRCAMGPNGASVSCLGDDFEAASAAAMWDGECSRSRIGCTAGSFKCILLNGRSVECRMTGGLSVFCECRGRLPSIPSPPSFLRLPTPANAAAANAPSVPLYVLTSGFGGARGEENARDAPRRAADCCPASLGGAAEFRE